MARGGNRFYSVANGRSTGVFRSWEECKSLVDGFKGARFKSFSSEEEARAFARSAPQQAATPRAYAPAAPASRNSYGGLRSDAIVTREYVDVDAYCAKAEPLNVYVDGSCINNGKGREARGGYGGYYGHNDERNFSYPLDSDERQTNNRGELKAAIHAVRQANISGNRQRLNIHTDSEYVIKGITSWISNWKRRGFEGVENTDLWQDLDRAVTHRKQHFGADAITFTHVRGHSGNHGNEMADQLAVQGSMKNMRR